MLCIKWCALSGSRKVFVSMENVWEEGSRSQWFFTVKSMSIPWLTDQIIKNHTANSLPFLTRNIKLIQKKKSRKTQLKICLESKHFKMRPALYKHFHLAGSKMLHTLVRVFYIQAVLESWDFGWLQGEFYQRMVKGEYSLAVIREFLVPLWPNGTANCWGYLTGCESLQPQLLGVREVSEVTITPGHCLATSQRNPGQTIPQNTKNQSKNSRRSTQAILEKLFIVWALRSLSK